MAVRIRILPDNNITDLVIVKAFADYKFNIAQVLELACRRAVTSWKKQKTLVTTALS